MSDSKSEEGGVLPPTSIRFTRQFDKIVDASHPHAGTTANPHLHILKPSAQAVIDTAYNLVSNPPRANQKWDYLEFYSPNPIVNESSHLGNELNIIVGAFYHNLLGLPRSTIWSNDLGNNFCRGVLANENNVSYASANCDEYKEAIAQLKKKIFKEGMPPHLAKLRDQTNLRMISEGIEDNLLPPGFQFNILKESDFRSEIGQIISKGHKLPSGLTQYKGVTVATSQGLPLYATSDLAYRGHITSNYKFPVILVGKDQENYHKSLSKIVGGVRIITVPTLKVEGKKMSKRSGDGIKFRDIVDQVCRNIPNLGRFRTELILKLIVLQHHHLPLITIEELIVKNRFKYWSDIIPHILEESTFSRDELVSCYRQNPELVQKWGYLNEVLLKSSLQLSATPILKFLEVLATIRDRSGSCDSDNLLGRFHSHMFKKVLRYCGLISL